MKRRGLKGIGAGFAMALAALTGTAQATQPVAQATQQERAGKTSELRATEKKKNFNKEIIQINSIGGLDIPPLTYNDYGLSPREYGLRFGNGKSRKGKLNKLALAHKAKVAKR